MLLCQPSFQKRKTVGEIYSDLSPFHERALGKR